MAVGIVPLWGHNRYPLLMKSMFGSRVEGYW